MLAWNGFLRQPEVLPAVNTSRKLAFEQIALIHAEHLLRFAMKFCADRARAEDLAQETLLSAWSNFHQFQLGTNCRAWLFKILVNLRNKEFCRWGSPTEPLNIDQQQTYLAVPENISNVTEVRVAFESLSEEHRDILRLGVVEGFSVRELADLLAIPPGTVMSRLSRARARLRTALGHVEMAQDVQ
jgi:RNA polymerase sigma-70 factor (ECF subfamily)